MVENEGKATRDFIYVNDIVRGLILCAARGVQGEVYNLASGIETSIIDLAKLVNQLTNNNTPTQFVPKRDWDNSGRRYWKSSSRPRTKLDLMSSWLLRTG